MGFGEVKHLKSHRVISQQGRKQKATFPPGSSPARPPQEDSSSSQPRNVQTQQTAPPARRLPNTQHLTRRSGPVLLSQCPRPRGRGAGESPGSKTTRRPGARRGPAQRSLLTAHSLLFYPSRQLPLIQILDLSQKHMTGWLRVRCEACARGQ